tara:strand:+ start:13 stop:1035 length:1023 start_codon:yes stop_codon:yes gene_type:complete
VLVKKSNNQVLVRKEIRAQYPVGAGAPIMVLGGGGGGGGSRGRTLREQAGGIAGGLVGVAGALTGNHRSLGGLVQSAISSGAQGKQIGSALGRKFVGREGQARADLREEMADKYATARASGEFDKYGISAERTPFTNIGVRLTEQGGDSMMGRRLAELQRAKESEKNTMAEERERAMADAKAFGADEGGRKRQMAEDLENFVKVTGMDPAKASAFMGQFGQRINAMQEEQATNQGQGNPVDPVQQATQTANNNFQTAGLGASNAVIPSPDGVVGETNRDGVLENAANYGAGAIDDEIDVGEGTSTPQGEASELEKLPSDREKLNTSLDRSKKVRVKPPEE